MTLRSDKARKTSKKIERKRRKLDNLLICLSPTSSHSISPFVAFGIMKNIYNIIIHNFSLFSVLWSCSRDSFPLLSPKITLPTKLPLKRSNRSLQLQQILYCINISIFYERTVVLASMEGELADAETLGRSHTSSVLASSFFASAISHTPKSRTLEYVEFTQQRKIETGWFYRHLCLSE